MAEISITKAAFAGVEVLRRKPATILIWYVVAVVIGALGIFLVSQTMGPALADMQAARSAGGRPDPQAAQAALGALGQVFQGLLLLIPIYLVLGAITTAAANRAVLRPDEAGFGYLRLGGDELRMIVVLLVIGLIMFVIYIVGILVASLIAAATSGAMSGGAPDPQKMATTLFIALAPVFIIMLLLGLKFAVAPAQTLDTRSINIFGSWTVTKGHFGKVFLTYLVAGLIAAVVYGVLFFISLAGAAAISGKSVADMMKPAAAAAMSITDPAMIFRILISGLIAVAGQALLVCPGASLYQQITGRQEDAFD